MNQLSRRLLVLGLPRGGTRTAAGLIAIAAPKLEIGHERMRRDGCVTGWWLVGIPPEAADMNFRHIWQLVRHPLEWISSAHAYIHGKTWIRFGLPESPTAADLGAFWTRAHSSLQACGPELLLRVEDLETLWPAMRLCVKQLGPYPGPVRIRHGDPALKLPVLWGDLGEHESDTREMARELGYAA